MSRPPVTTIHYCHASRLHPCVNSSRFCLLRLRPRPPHQPLYSSSVAPPSHPATMRHRLHPPRARLPMVLLPYSMLPPHATMHASAPATFTRLHPIADASCYPVATTTIEEHHPLSLIMSSAMNKRPKP
ncbi:hypothetical protein L1987_43597 [Smallanthus sonchifolius]|uniref:Uncharacterized protein n=1 Tax=Smallanthus sonchifolius TaxID=185202 RepID=A0ACB9GMU6_9ASTR|nr:hypothetical protein L1987_43597 [Smallanthus sonchifolius]